MDDGLLSISGLVACFLLAGLIAMVWVYTRWSRRPPAWKENTARLPWRPWLFADGAILGGYFLLLLAAQYVLSMARQKPDLDGRGFDVVTLLQAALLSHGILLAYVLVQMRRRQLSWAGAFGVRLRRLPVDAARGGLFYMALVPALVVVSIVNALLLRLAGFAPAIQPVLHELSVTVSPAAKTLFVIWAVLVAPVIEECVFRGVMFPAFSRRFGVRTAVVMTSVFFALVHNQIPALLPLAGLSVALCIAYLATESLAVPMVMHMCFNAVSTAAILLVS